MRLIDADELLILEAAAYVKAQAKTDDKVTRLVNEVVHKKTQMLVSDAPIAYDVDKVVERLEEYQEAFPECNKEDYFRGVGVGIKNCIEIVKAGVEID